MATYFIRQGTFAPQGPFDEARVAGYIAQGKVRAGMEISADGERWMPVEEHRLFAAAAPPVRAIATPQPVRAVKPGEDVEVVEEISAAPAARPDRRPARRPRPAPASGGGRKAVVAVVGLLVVGAIAYVALKGEHEIGQSLAERSARAEPPVADLSAAALLRDYMANGIAADAKYKGKPLRVSGPVKSIGTDFSGRPYVALDAENLVLSVQCYFAEAHRAQAAALSQGQPVVVRGLCYGKTINVIIEGATFETAGSAPPAPVAATTDSGSAVRARPTVAEFRCRFQALFDRHEVLRRVPFRRVLEEFGKPDDHQTLDGTPMWVLYRLTDGELKAAVMDGFVYSFQGGTAAEIAAAAKEEERKQQERDAAAQAARAREQEEQRQRDARERADREAREKADADAEAKRVAEATAARERKFAALYALGAGVYSLLPNTIGWTWVKEEIGGERGKRAPDTAVQYVLELGADRTAKATLKISGTVVWERNGEWAIDKLEDGNWAASTEDDGTTATAQFVRAAVTLQSAGVGDYMPPEGRLLVEIWAERADVRATLVGRGEQWMRRTGGGATEATPVGPATAADLVGEYQPTPETLGDRKVTFRIVLSKDSTFTTTFKGESGSAKVYKGSWRFDGEKVIMTATTLNGTRLREQQVEEIPLDGDELVAGEYWMRKVKK